MEYLTLHTVRLPFTTREFYTLCDIKTNHADFIGVAMTSFITVKASYYNNSSITYMYCQDCKEAITPMDLLNAVEL